MTKDHTGMDLMGIVPVQRPVCHVRILIRGLERPTLTGLSYSVRSYPNGGDMVIVSVRLSRSNCFYDSIFTTMFEREGESSAKSTECGDHRLAWVPRQIGSDSSHTCRQEIFCWNNGLPDLLLRIEL
jgi:hypothetical protein